jgi:hypothetical protein
MRPVFEERSFRAPRRFVEQFAIIDTEPREQRQIVRPNHDAHRIDLEELGRSDDALERPGIDLEAFAVEALGSERPGSRFVQR